jgi:hypothetical protein
MCLNLHRLATMEQQLLTFHEIECVASEEHTGGADLNAHEAKLIGLAERVIAGDESIKVQSFIRNLTR